MLHIWLNRFLFKLFINLDETNVIFLEFLKGFVSTYCQDKDIL
jgi:hypothetical protein